MASRSIASTACLRERPCRRTSDRHVSNSSAWPITARTLFVAASRAQVVGEPVRHRGGFRHGLRVLGNNGCVSRRTSRSDSTSSNQAYTSESTPRRRCGASSSSQPRVRSGCWPGQWPSRRERASFVGEARVDRVPLDVCARAIAEMVVRAGPIDVWTSTVASTIRCPVSGPDARARSFSSYFLFYCTTVYLDLDKCERPLLRSLHIDVQRKEFDMFTFDLDEFELPPMGPGVSSVSLAPQRHRNGEHGHCAVRARPRRRASCAHGQR